jgi:hypothetical protein
MSDANGKSSRLNPTLRTRLVLWMHEHRESLTNRRLTVGQLADAATEHLGFRVRVGVAMAVARDVGVVTITKSVDPTRRYRERVMLREVARHLVHLYSELGLDPPSTLIAFLQENVNNPSGK